MTRRKAIYCESYGHSQPIPAACLLGNTLVSGIIHGLDAGLAGGGSLETQAALMFQRVRDVLAAAGASTDDIVKLNITMTDRAQRNAINDHWVAMFPDPASRPVRQTVEAPLDQGKLVQCDLVAILG
jgi:2-iminobutanoate/2-iminopropanoate deaminase